MCQPELGTPLLRIETPISSAYSRPVPAREAPRAFIVYLVANFWIVKVGQ